MSPQTDSFKIPKDTQIFGMNVPFISSSEVKKTYFMGGVKFFSLHEMK